MAPLFDRLTSDNKFHEPSYWRDIKRSLSLGDYTYPTPYWQCVPEYPVSHTPNTPFSGQVPQSCALAAARSPCRFPLHLDHMEIVCLHINWRNILEPLGFQSFGVFLPLYNRKTTQPWLQIVYLRWTPHQNVWSTPDTCKNGTVKFGRTEYSKLSLKISKYWVIFRDWYFLTEVFLCWLQGRSQQT